MDDLNSDQRAPGTHRPPADDEIAATTLAALLRRLTPHVFVTLSILALLIAGFVASVIAGAHPVSPTGEQLIAVGGNYGPRVSDGQWWRLLTSTLLHAGIIHLVMNFWVMVQAGPLTERLFGNLSFAAIYILSAVGGSLLSVTVHPMQVGVGASGAIFGVVGALLVFVTTHQGVVPRDALVKQRNSLLLFIVVNLVYGFAQPNIDMSAHFGGFIVGAVAGLLLSRDLLAPRAGAKRRALGVVGMVVVLAVCGFGMRWRLQRVPQIEATRLVREAQEEYRAHRYDRVLALYDRVFALVAHPNPQLLLTRGAARSQLNQLREALADWAAYEAGVAADKRIDVSEFQCAASATLVDPTVEELAAGRAFCTRALARPAAEITPALLHLLRGGLAARAKTYPEALADFTASIDADPKNAEAHVGRAWIELALGQYRRSIADLDVTESIKPADGTLLNNRAWAKLMLGDFAGARSDADRAVALQPQSGLVWGTRCFVLEGLGERAAATADCTKAVELCTSPDACHHDKGMLAFLQGDKAEARRQWQLAAAQGAQAANELARYLALVR